MSTLDLAGPRHHTTGGSDVVGWTAVGVGAMGAVAAFTQRVLEVGPRNCMLRVLADIPCPVCGLSTTAVHLGQGDVGGALQADGFGVALLVLVAIVAVVQVGRVLRLSQWRPPPVKTAVLAGVLLAGHWLATLTGVVDLAPLT